MKKVLLLSITFTALFLYGINYFSNLIAISYNYEIAIVIAGFSLLFNASFVIG